MPYRPRVIDHEPTGAFWTSVPSSGLVACAPVELLEPIEDQMQLVGSALGFLGILHQDNPSNGLDFLDELGRGDPYTYVVDAGSRLGLEFGVLGLPETFLVDRDGTIVGKISGPISNPQVLVNAIDDLILGREIGTIKVGEVENR